VKNTDKLKITVIIPFYNEEMVLKNVVEAVVGSKIFEE
jgi:cellulose synthase/poly-beta-1,6-N-acetylglucosamine synthase-like glycosyltransferase